MLRTILRALLIFPFPAILLFLLAWPIVKNVGWEIVAIFCGAIVLSEQLFFLGLWLMDNSEKS